MYNVTRKDMEFTQYTLCLDLHTPPVRFSHYNFSLLADSTMPVKGIPKASISRNGLGAFVLPCHRVKIQYCNWGGSSTGVRHLLASGTLNKIATEKPGIFFEVVKKAGPPKLTFHYSPDKTRDIDVRNMDLKLLIKTVNEYSQASGNPLFKWNHKVISDNESVRGVWSPLHLPKDARHRI